MEFMPPLQAATLVRRYKRFLADVITSEGQPLTLHCPNTGAMTGCGQSGDRVWYSTSANPTRKYPHTWEMTQTQAGEWICVNTQRANALTEEAILAQRIPPLAGYTQCKREVKYGNEQSRCDFLLQAEDRVRCYIEVKSVTLSECGKGYFPDAVTERGQKHLRELISVANQGDRAVLLFAVLHSAIINVSPARHIDPKYAQLLEEAITAGVEVLAWGSTLNAKNMALNKPLNVIV